MSNQQNYESEHHNSLVDYSHVDPSTEACNKLYLEVKQKAIKKGYKNFKVRGLKIDFSDN